MFSTFTALIWTYCKKKEYHYQRASGILLSNKII